ncbi:MAG: PfkB family carbohydrate kinase [bacterium]|nr:PfkB family carbohydrate kinase [bacterium]
MMNHSNPLVITVTLNPLIDKTVYVDKLVPGKIHRAICGPEIVGGKGINVSRAVKRLGGDSIAITFIGGEIGTHLSTLLHQERIPSRFVRTITPTRLQISILEQSNNKSTSIIFPNTGVSQEELDTLLFELSNLLVRQNKKSILVISGSAPSGDMDTSIKKIIHMANKFKIKTILDSYGTAFARALSERPFCVRQNRKEAELYFNHRLTHQGDILDAIAEYFKLGIKFAIITSGANAVYAGYNGYFWKVTPPKVTTVNPTGSGDAMTASIALDLLTIDASDLSLKQAERILIKSVAAGAANATVWLPCDITKKMVTELTPKVKIKRVV